MGVKVLGVLSWLLHVVVVSNPGPLFPPPGSAPQGYDSLTLNGELRPLTALVRAGPASVPVTEQPAPSQPP